MAQVTAVNWLIHNIVKDKSIKSISINDWIPLFHQAEAMERQQLANSWDKACEQYIYRDGNLVKVWKDFEKYYNETYVK